MNNEFFDIFVFISMILAGLYAYWSFKKNNKHELF